MLKDCPNCGAKNILFGGVKDGDLTFCSKECYGFYQNKGFCEACTQATDEKEAGGTATLNGIGTRLHGGKDRCPTCHSVIQTKYFCVLFIPVIPLKRYRVLYCMPKRYFSRQLKPAAPKNAYGRKAP